MRASPAFCAAVGTETTPQRLEDQRVIGLQCRTCLGEELATCRIYKVHEFTCDAGHRNVKSVRLCSLEHESRCSPSGREP